MAGTGSRDAGDGSGRPLSFRRDYGVLAANFCVRAAAGLAAGYVLRWAATPVLGFRRSVPFFAAGCGAGYAAKEANTYLEAPADVRVLTAYEQFLQSQRKGCALVNDARSTVASAWQRISRSEK